MDHIYTFATDGSLLFLLAIALTFVSAFGLLYPLLNRMEARDRFNRIIHEQRRSLFELDQSIQALRAQLGDTPPVVQLTGHYHNLLRQWSEV